MALVTGLCAFFLSVSTFCAVHAADLQPQHATQCVSNDKRRWMDAFLETQVVNETLQREAWADFPSGEQGVADFEAKRYKVLKKLAEGHEGVVFAAVDTDTMELVAIKKVKWLFEPRRHPAVRLWKEIQMMRIVSGSDDHMKLKRMMFPKKRRSFNTAFMVLAMLEMSVPKKVATNAGGIAETSGQSRLKLWTFQLLRALHYMHTAGIAHNDLRHFNTMLDKSCDLKIIDLGISDIAEEAPEEVKPGTLPMPIIGDFLQYRRDIWMAGVHIMVTIGGSHEYHLARKPEENQALQIVRALGSPDQSILELYDEDARGAFELAEKTISKEGTPYVPLPERFPGVDPALFKLVHRMLRLDRQVPTTGELLQDSYFDDMDRSTIKDSPPKSDAKSMLEDREKVGLTERSARAYLLEAIEVNQGASKNTQQDPKSSRKARKFSIDDQ